MNEDKRNDLEAELRCLHSDLYYAQTVGDWKMSRSMEKTIKALKDVKSIEDVAFHFGELYENLKYDIEEREKMRIRIEEIEEELENI